MPGDHGDPEQLIDRRGEINQLLVDETGCTVGVDPYRARPGRAARDTRGWSLAKEWIGSNRARKERLQLPAATTTEPGGRVPAHHDVT